MASTSHLLALLKELGGVVRADVVAERGISRWVLDAATSRGEVIRPRRGWVALPTAEKTLIAAARFGVVLTCRTQASLLGLWLHDHRGRPHFGVPRHAKRRLKVDAKLHWERLSYLEIPMRSSIPSRTSSRTSRNASRSSGRSPHGSPPSTSHW